MRMIAGGIARPQRLAIGLAVVAAAAAAGALVPVYVGAMGDGIARLAALPAAIALGFAFVFARRFLFLSVIFFRPLCDPLFEAMRFGSGAGLGGVANALVILMAFVLLVEKPAAVGRTAVPMWVPLMVAALISAVQAPEPAQGVKYFLVYLSYAAVFSIPFFLEECRQGMGFAVRFVVAASVLPALCGIVDFARGGGGGELAGRISSTFEHPNIFAFYLVFNISLVLYLLKSTLVRVSRAQRLLLVAYMALLFALLLLTKTRSAWAASLVVFVVYGVMFERRMLVYLAAGAGLLLLLPAVQDRLADLAQGNERIQFSQLNSYAWRKLIWETGLAWMKPESLPLGYGIDAFRYYSPVFFPLAGNFNHGAHSVYVQWFFEAGMFGVACAAWLFYRLFAMLASGMRTDRLGTVILVTVVLEYLVMSYSDNMLSYLSFNWHFWFLMGAACAFNTAGRPRAPAAVRGVAGPAARA
ncbi:MAG TPA: O-antigen ligase family protein, partial [Burkholderiales bacterium]|nr:O-antigen ligase family protein [Burkholderiales bacterium]